MVAGKSLPTPSSDAIVEDLNFCVESFKGPLALDVVWPVGDVLAGRHRIDELLEFDATVLISQRPA
jgi:hypothetical protein